jgi:hypothetical protein
LQRSADKRKYGAPAESISTRVAPPSSANASDAAAFGMIGLLSSTRIGTPETFEQGASERHDAMAAKGALWGQALGDAAGANALGLSGIGLGGGGRGEGIGLGSVGTLGHGAGPAGDGTGGRGSSLSGHGRLGWHRSWNARYRCSYCTATVGGRLPPETVRRVVQQNSGRFRACYEKKLLTNPALSGRVTTKFVIGRDGSVVASESSGSDLPDDDVVACVVRAFGSLSFPQPEGGIVTVVYPLVFSSEATPTQNFSFSSPVSI